MAGTITLDPWVLNPNTDRYESNYDPGPTLYHGDEIDISGTGFGSMPTIFFSGGKNGRIESKDEGVTDNENTGGFNTTQGRPKIVEYDSTRGKVWKSVVWDGNLVTADNGIIYCDMGFDAALGSKMLTFFHNKINCDATEFQWKSHRREPFFNYEDGGPELVTFVRKVAARQILLRANVADSAEGAIWYGNSTNCQPLDNQWLLNEFYEELNTSLGTTTGYIAYKTYIGGVQYTLANQAVNNIGSTAGSLTARCVVLQNIITNYNQNIENGTPPSVGEVWVDDFAVQYAAPGEDLVRVYLSNSATFSASTLTPEFQMPVTGWTNTNVRVKINRGAAPNGDYYLCVVKNNGVQIASAPFRLVGSKE